MSNAIFPTLAGIGWDIVRSTVWDTTVQTNNSGKEVRIANQTYPRYTWQLTFDFLRQGIIAGIAFTEFSQLFGFFNARQGKFDTFLYTDVDDNSVTAQPLGTGDGSTTSFQLVRSFGGFIEPVLAPNSVSHVYLNGVNQASGWSVSSWGSANPGVVTFTSAPAAGVAVTADLTYYWPCRFNDDSVSFNKFVSTMYAGKKLTFLTVKS